MYMATHDTHLFHICQAQNAYYMATLFARKIPIVNDISICYVHY